MTQTPEPMQEKTYRAGTYQQIGNCIYWTPNRVIDAITIEPRPVSIDVALAILGITAAPAAPTPEPVDLPPANPPFGV